MATKTLLQTVRDHLEQNKGAWREIADASGVPYSTICKIAQGVTENPGVIGVQSLFDHFQKAAQ